MFRAPITVEVKVHFANDAEGLEGAGVVGMAPGVPVTQKDLLEAIGKTLAALPSGCRLLTPFEFFNGVVVKEMTGRKGNFAIPSEFAYDEEALAAAAKAAFEESQDGKEEE